MPQLRQPHFFLARFWRELAETAPDLRAELEACEPAVLNFASRMPPSITDRTPQPCDEELVAMGFRRPTFERALRNWVERQPNLTYRCGAEVASLVADTEGAVPRVCGVELTDGTVIDADLVVAATGRHGAATRWLQEIGAGPIEEEEADGGLAYFSRYYRLTPGASFPAIQGRPSQECGSLIVFTFPADHGTFTLAATPLADDKEMRGMKDNDAFDRLMRLIPVTAPWLEDGRATAISNVAPLMRIEDRRRRIVANGVPAATGIVLTADAAFCTNPVLGRGTSLAWLTGRRLGEVVAEHGDDVEKVALAFDEILEHEIRPWYDDSLATDKARFTQIDTHRRGETPPPPDPSDVAATMSAAVQLAMGFDAEVFRAGVRRFNLLDPLDGLMHNGDVLGRVIAFWERRSELPSPPAPPTRAEMLAAIAG